MGPFAKPKVLPIYPPPPAPESFNRLTRKDFWNDPERWEGIDDPRKTMIWEVRRPDRIDVAPPKPIGGQFDPHSAKHQQLLNQQANAQCQSQYAAYQSQLQSQVLLNSQYRPRSLATANIYRAMIYVVTHCNHTNNGKAE